MSSTEAPHTVLVHVNVEIAHGTWLDLQEGLYTQYLAAEAAEPTGIGPVPYEEWIADFGPASAMIARVLADEVAGAIAVGTDEDETVILYEATAVTVPLAEEV